MLLRPDLDREERDIGRISARYFAAFKLRVTGIFRWMLMPVPAGTRAVPMEPFRHNPPSEQEEH